MAMSPAKVTRVGNLAAGSLIKRPIRFCEQCMRLAHATNPAPCHVAPHGKTAPHPHRTSAFKQEIPILATCQFSIGYYGIWDGKNCCRSPTAEAEQENKINEK